MALVPALDLRPVSNDPVIAHAPANIEAEQALLGALLYDNAAFERLGDYLQARHFYEPFHARLFQAVETQIRKGQLAEPILLAEQFVRDAAFGWNTPLLTALSSATVAALSAVAAAALSFAWSAVRTRLTSVRTALVTARLRSVRLIRWRLRFSADG